MTVAERFFEKVAKSEACWEWTAAKDSSGYGCISIGGRLDGAHRVSWRIAFGEIPNGLLVLHKCDNRSCVNPDHLFLGTVKDNVQDMVAKGRNVAGEGRRKLTATQVVDVFRLRAKGWLQREIAQEMRVSQKQISRILRGENWKQRHSTA